MTVLYKFLPPSRITYFKDELLRFSPPGALNDPYECLPALTDQQVRSLAFKMKKSLKKHSKGVDKRIKKEIVKKYNLPKTPQDVREAYYERLVNKMNNLVGVFSVSRSWDISLMWSHYTESHSGFCIGFNDQHDFFRKGEVVEGEIIATVPVRYSDKRSTVPKSETTADMARSVLATKASEWGYEKEERVIRLLERADKKVEAKPFNIDLFKVPHEAVVEIIVGINSSSALVEAAKEFGKILKVPVYKTKISNDSFNFTRFPL